MYTDKFRKNGPAPRIGIIEDNTNRYESHASNEEAKRLVEFMGGIPVPLQYTDPGNGNYNGNPLKDVEGLDGLIILGNRSDLDPADYGQPLHPKAGIYTNKSDKARATYEKEMIPAALERKIPMFLACAGMQRLNVTLGGTLYQHIPDQLDGNNQHLTNNGYPHDPGAPNLPVEIVPGTVFAGMMEKLAKSGKKFTSDFNPKKPLNIMANSIHHQAIDKVGDGLRVAAYGVTKLRDGSEVKTIEAVETDPNGKLAGQFIQGRQWHPELTPESDVSKAMYREFIAAAAEYAKQQGRDNSHAAALHAGRDSGNHPSL